MTPTHARLLGMPFADVEAEYQRRMRQDRDPADLATLEAIDELWHPETVSLAAENIDRILGTLPTRQAQRIQARLWDEAHRLAVWEALILKHPPLDDDTPPPAWIADVAAVLDLLPSAPPRLD